MILFLEEQWMKCHVVSINFNKQTATYKGAVCLQWHRHVLVFWLCIFWCAVARYCVTLSPPVSFCLTGKDKDEVVALKATHPQAAKALSGPPLYCCTRLVQAWN